MQISLLGSESLHPDAIPLLHLPPNRSKNRHKIVREEIQYKSANEKKIVIGIKGGTYEESKLKGDTIVLENEQQLDQIVDEYQKIMSENKIRSFEDFSENVETKLNFNNSWHVLKDFEGVCFYQLNSRHHRVCFGTKIIVNQELRVRIIMKDCVLPEDSSQLQYWLQLEKILNQFSRECKLELEPSYCMSKALEFLSRINDASLDIENNLQLNFLKVNISNCLKG